MKENLHSILEKIFRCRHFITERKSLTFIGIFMILCCVMNVAVLAKDVLNRSAHPTASCFSKFEIRMPPLISTEVSGVKIKREFHPL